MDLPEDNNRVSTPVRLHQKLLGQPNTASGMLMIFGISLLIVALLGLLFGQSIGYHRGLSYAAEQSKRIADGEEISASNVKALRHKTESLQSQLQTAQQERDISLANLVELRNDNQNLTITNLQMQQGQQFFTQAIAKKGGIPLQVIGAKIVPLPENAYEYRFDVGMVDTSNQEKMLKPTLTLLDEVNMVNVPLKPDTYRINGIARIRGRFIMPKGFTPKQMKLDLTAGNQTAQQIYDWQLGKPIDNMPYSLEETPEADKRPVSAPDSTTISTNAP